ncbi:MAG: ABC transporter substrate-binding protein [Alphaproteobacteria bacterium]|nr:ABC transporter substrate-binding protein [Alphaproteobacteria bacterium]
MLKRLAALAVVLLPLASATASEPVLLAIDAEFGLPNSTSAQAIELGARIAVDQINAAGGVLGRPFALITTDNQSVPARARDNLAELADTKDLVAVLCGRYSPIVLETIDLLHEKKLIMLDPWASADGITDHQHVPSYIFRLSLRDSYAMPTMLRHAVGKGAARVALLVPNTSWGRSNASAAQLAAGPAGVQIVGTEWYNWGDRDFADKYAALRASGAQAVILVANDMEGSAFAKQVAALPAERRLPIISHWGITGGRFVEETGPGLFELDFSVVQTFSFFTAAPGPLAAFAATHETLYGRFDPAAIPAPVGAGHAFDLVHILARAVQRAGTTDRAAVRDALEAVRDHDGLIRRLAQPFTATRHDALEQSDVFMAAYRRDGAIVPIGRAGAAR